MFSQFYEFSWTYFPEHYFSLFWDFNFKFHMHISHATVSKPLICFCLKYQNLSVNRFDAFSWTWFPERNMLLLWVCHFEFYMRLTNATFLESHWVSCLKVNLCIFVILTERWSEVNWSLIHTDQPKYWCVAEVAWETTDISFFFGNNKKESYSHDNAFQNSVCKMHIHSATFILGQFYTRCFNHQSLKSVLK